MLLTTDFGSGVGDEFGFEVPNGDPGAIHAAAGSFSTLAGALRLQQRMIVSGSSTAADGADWKGAAADRFMARAQHVGTVFATNASACDDAAKALHSLATELEVAQRATSAAVSACQTAFQDQLAQQRAADEAEYDAQQARSSARAHPTAAAHYNGLADAADSQRSTAQSAADAAASDLARAKREGEAAEDTYKHAAASAIAQLHSAEADLKPAPHDAESIMKSIAERLEPYLKSAGAGDDAGDTFNKGMEKYEEQQAEMEARQQETEAKQSLNANRDAQNSTPEDQQSGDQSSDGEDSGKDAEPSESSPANADGDPDATSESASSEVKATTQDLTETVEGDSEDIAPEIGYGLAAASFVDDLAEGKGVVDSVVEVGEDYGKSMVEGAAAAEIGAEVAPLILVPGVGEAVVAGVVAVAAFEVISHPKAVIHAVESVADDIGDLF